MSKPPDKPREREVDRDRKHDVRNDSRDQSDDPKRASREGEDAPRGPEASTRRAPQGQPGGHGPTTPGTSSEPDAPE